MASDKTVHEQLPEQPVYEKRLTPGEFQEVLMNPSDFYNDIHQNGDGVAQLIIDKGNGGKMEMVYIVGNTSGINHPSLLDQLLRTQGKIDANYLPAHIDSIINNGVLSSEGAKLAREWEYLTSLVDAFDPSSFYGDTNAGDQTGPIIFLQNIQDESTAHRDARKVYNPFTKQSHAEKLRGVINEKLTSLVSPDDLMENGEVVISLDKLSAELPMRVVAEYLDLSDDEQGRMIAAMFKSGNFFGGEGQTDQVVKDAVEALKEIRALYTKKINQRRKQREDNGGEIPENLAGNSFIAHMVNLENKPQFAHFKNRYIYDRRGKRIEDPFLEWAINQCNAMQNAGTSTTDGGINLLITNLIANPKIFEYAVENKDNNAVLEYIVREFGRINSPVPAGRRVVNEKTQLMRPNQGPFTLDVGTTIYVSFEGANHDPNIFDSPTKFKLDRDHASWHKKYGGGLRFCTGRNTAHLQELMVLKQILDSGVTQLSYADGIVGTARIPTLIFTKNIGLGINPEGVPVPTEIFVKMKR